MFVAIIFYFVSSSTSYEPNILHLYNHNVSSFELNTWNICKCKAERTIINSNSKKKVKDRNNRKFKAVGIDNRRRHSWKRFQHRITILSSETGNLCKGQKIICTKIEKGKSFSTVWESGAPLLQDRRAVGILSIKHLYEGDYYVEYADIEENQQWIRGNTNPPIEIARALIIDCSTKVKG